MKIDRTMVNNVEVVNCIIPRIISYGCEPDASDVNIIAYNKDTRHNQIGLQLYGDSVSPDEGDTLS